MPIMATLVFLSINGKTLMIHRVTKEHVLQEGKFNGLVGKFEPGESPLGCAKRDVIEESALTRDDIYFKGHILFPTFSEVVLPNFCEPILSNEKETIGVFVVLSNLGCASTRFSPLRITLLLTFNSSPFSDKSLSRPNSFSLFDTILKLNLAVFPKRLLILSGSFNTSI